MHAIYSPAVAMVTGAASGLGREIALQLAARNCTVVCVDYNTDVLQVLELKAANRSALCVRARIAKRAEVVGLMQWVAPEFGCLDILPSMRVRDWQHLGNWRTWRDCSAANAASSRVTLGISRAVARLPFGAADAAPRRNPNLLVRSWPTQTSSSLMRNTLQDDIRVKLRIAIERGA